MPIPPNPRTPGRSTENRPDGAGRRTAARDYHQCCDIDVFKVEKHMDTYECRETMKKCVGSLRATARTGGWGEVVERRGFGCICNVFIRKLGTGYPDVYGNILCGFLTYLKYFSIIPFQRGERGCFTFCKKCCWGIVGGGG